MRNRIAVGTVALLFAGSGLGALALTNGKVGGAARADCPGQIICPLTGQAVCRDECPRVDPNRPDCPGQIVCPQTGELVCADLCPAESAIAALPPCCAGKN